MALRVEREGKTSREGERVEGLKCFGRDIAMMDFEVSDAE